MIIAVLGGVAAFLGLLGLLAASYVVVRSSATKQAAESWREEAEAQKARADRLEETVSDLQTRVERLETDNRRLADLATNRTAISGLQELIRSQHSETLAAILALHSVQTKEG